MNTNIEFVEPINEPTKIIIKFGGEEYDITDLKNIYKCMPEAYIYICFFEPIL